MMYYINLISEILKEQHAKRLAKEREEWQYLHYND